MSAVDEVKVNQMQSQQQQQRDATVDELSISSAGISLTVVPTTTNEGKPHHQMMNSGGEAEQEEDSDRMHPVMAKFIKTQHQPRLFSHLENEDGFDYYAVLGTSWNIPESNCFATYFKKVKLLFQFFVLVSVQIFGPIYIGYEAIESHEEHWKHCRYNDWNHASICAKWLAFGLAFLFALAFRTVVMTKLTSGVYLFLRADRSAVPAFINYNFLSCGYAISMICVFLVYFESFLLIHLSDSMYEILANGMLLYFFSALPNLIPGSEEYQNIRCLLNDKRFLNKNGELKWDVHQGTATCRYTEGCCFKILEAILAILPLVIFVCH